MASRDNCLLVAWTTHAKTIIVCHQLPTMGGSSTKERQMRLVGEGESLAVEMDQEDRLADPRLQERYPLRGEYTVSNEMTIEQIVELILKRDWYWCNKQEVIAYSLIHLQDEA